MRSVRGLLVALLFVLVGGLGPASAIAISPPPTTAEMHAASPNGASSGVPGDRWIDRAWHGYYSAERSALHEKLIGEFLSHGTSSGAPRIMFTSGPYAAGKTTVLRQLQSLGLVNLNDFVVVDMDQIRERLPEFKAFNDENRQTAAERTQKESGYIAELLIWRAVAQGKNILIDGSMGNAEFWSALLEKIALEAPAYRGRTELVHVSAQLKSLFDRVEERNRKESRFTPLEQVKASYFKSMQAFSYLRDKMDSVVEFDTSFREPRVVSLKLAPFDGGHLLDGLNLPIAKSLSLAQAQDEKVASHKGLAATLFPAASVRPPNKGYHIVIDLDWTLLYSITDVSRVPSKELIRYDGPSGTEFYRFSDHAAELVENLLRLPGTKVSFFSGGDQERNEFVLRGLKLSDGRSAFDVATHVFSKEHLTPLSDDPNVKFADRFKKRLQGLIPDLDLTRTVLVDDQPRFAMKGLRVVNAHGRFNFSRSFEPARTGQMFEPASEEQFRMGRGKLAMAYAVIERSLYADLQGRAVFADAAEMLMKDPRTGDWLPLESPRLRVLYNRGIEALGEAKRGGSCRAVFGRR